MFTQESVLYQNVDTNRASRSKPSDFNNEAIGEALTSRESGFIMLIRNISNIAVEDLDFFYDSDKTAQFVKFRFVNKGITIRNCMFRSGLPPSESHEELYFVSYDAISLSVTEGATGEHMIQNFGGQWRQEQEDQNWESRLSQCLRVKEDESQSRHKYGKRQNVVF